MGRLAEEWLISDDPNMPSTDVSDLQLPKGAGSGSSEIVPVAAASAIVIRRETFEVLMLRRNDKSSFVPGSWIFPGGTVEPSDSALAQTLAQGDSELTTMRICAARELLEEAGIWIGSPLEDHHALRASLLDRTGDVRDLALENPDNLNALVFTSRWITPIGVPKRFDTCFFLLVVPEETRATPEDREVVEVIWVTPAEALRQQEEGSLPMVFPTIKNLEAIAKFSSVAQLIEARREAIVTTTRPRLVIENGKKRIILPEEEES